MPFTKVDLPDPLTPVTTSSTFSGNFTSIPFKLFCLAPFSSMAMFHDLRELGLSIVSFPVRYWMVWERENCLANCSLLRSISLMDPLKTISPPSLPALGPTSIRVSAACMISLSCSTTMTVLPNACSFFSTLINRFVSRLCKPMLGSSRI